MLNAKYDFFISIQILDIEKVHLLSEIERLKNEPDILKTRSTLEKESLGVERQVKT